jgi:aminopeptidase
MDAATLARYADLIVRSGLGIEEGEVLAVHSEPAHRPLAVALAEAGYRHGARYVDVTVFDDRVRRARIVGAHDPATLGEQPPWQAARMRWLVAQEAGLVSINGPEERAALAGVDRARAIVERSHRVPGIAVYLRAVMSGRARFCVVCWPTPGWAASAYPECDPEEATRRVAADLARFCRIGPGDGEGTAAWDAHVAVLTERAAALNALDLDHVELRGPGTSLDVGLLADGHFVAADELTPAGRRFRANIPTEEVFTSPDPRRVEGTFACTRPLALEGRFIHGIRGELRGGRLVSVDADGDDDRAFIAAHLARDRGAGRLGELALVDSTSRIGQSGRVYGLTLLDENAASHIAFGSGYQNAGGRRVNRSSIHTDVMIGADEVEVTGVARGGRRVPLIAGGRFAV